MTQKLVVIGLDAATPDLVFSELLDELPHLRALIKNGAWGRLRSTSPPITVPAWSVMTSGMNPGQLGFFGFRNRWRGSYDDGFVATGDRVRVKRAWDYASDAGLHVSVHGVPGTFPAYPVNGTMTACFLAPDAEDAGFAWPEKAGETVRALVPDFHVDVPDFRSADKARVLAGVHRVRDDRFAVAERFLEDAAWDFFMMVDMGVDRVQHAFWEFHDPAHHAYPGPGNAFESAIRDYYKSVDARIGRLLERVPADARVMVVSDHGAKRADGAVRVNDWLRAEGDLVLLREPDAPGPFRVEDVDWSRTKAWAFGGYHARVFINVEGREPHGIVPVAEYEAYRADLARRLALVPGPDGALLQGTRVARPEDEYGLATGVDLAAAPDLHVYFGDLHWKATQGVGGRDVCSRGSEVGPDGAVHDWDGIFAFHDPARPLGGRELTGARLEDVAPTLLRLLGIPPPEGLAGRALPGLPYPAPAFPQPATTARDPATIRTATARELPVHARLARGGRDGA